jgi:hypothetical protein
MRLIMFGRIILLLLFGVLYSVHGDSASQTDWSGGPDEYGPLSQWNSQFYESENVDWSGSSGSISLLLPSSHLVSDLFLSAICVYSADINGDGNMDIIGAAHMGNEVVWWENTNGSGTSWAEHTVDGSFTAPVSVFPEDIDSDGDIDILGTSDSDYDLVWWENYSGAVKVDR